LIEAPRSRPARAAAEQVLVRVVHHCGSRPDCVVLGGLVPELLCSGSAFRHAGATGREIVGTLNGRGVSWPTAEIAGTENHAHLGSVFGRIAVIKM